MSSPAPIRSASPPPTTDDVELSTTIGASPQNRRTATRSPSPRDRSRTRSRSRTRTHSRSPSRGRSRTRTRSPTHSTSPAPISAKIVIEKLTKNVNSGHLREIFSTYGTITELEMPLNPQFMMNKGIAYILYSAAAEAEEAIACMHEAQLDGAVINVSIVLPRRRFSRSPAMKRPPPDRFGEPHRLRPGPERGGRGGGIGMGRGGDRAFGPRGPPPGRASPNYGGTGGGRRSSPPRYSGGGRGGGGRGGYRDRFEDRDGRDGYHGRSPPRRRRSPSYDSRSRSPSYGSRSPPPRRRDRSPPARRGGDGGRGGGGRVRRSPSYDSYSSRSRSRSRERGGRRR
ncbi:hypothetical protein LTR62_004154 [Meristemomyces frigidus]|uniref:RRM domain-containing protein n=1 Tax=Meristemomyces frigidus TaxID=1508187 RepID=A0AAN7TPQ2_9PEZI|nr:hypothetical protein LTR62_004154 [Meristemomyces frigidus]